jgi:hypothetical protein
MKYTEGADISHSYPRHWIEVSGQLYASAGFTPEKKTGTH